MTPERQKWWDSLPKEEKRVRLAIEKEKKYLSHYKHEGAINIKGFINYQKLLIKALRKQIAMRPIVFKYPGYKSYECPRCREGAITYLPHCSMCGQKLRWKECVD